MHFACSGRQMAEQMQRENPEVLEQLRSQFGGEEGTVNYITLSNPFVLKRFGVNKLILVPECEGCRYGYAQDVEN